MSEDNIFLYYLVLTKIPGFGSVRQNRLLDLCGGDIEWCFTADLGAETKPVNPSDEKLIRMFVSRREDDALFEQAQRVLEESREKGIQLICRQDHNYPERFRGIADIPVLLYVKGNLKINEFRHSVGIIGARRCTRDGRDRTIKLTKTAIADGKAVISGMAKGIDSYAHTAAVLENGYTIAVLGCGPDVCYPSEHRALYEEIIAKGCILSEYPPSTTPREYMFHRRNRLIAALSDELYIIEAGRNSGTESTAAFCKLFGRKVHTDESCVS